MFKKLSPFSTMCLKTLWLQRCQNVSVSYSTIDRSPWYTVFINMLLYGVFISNMFTCEPSTWQSFPRYNKSVADDFKKRFWQKSEMKVHLLIELKTFWQKEKLLVLSNFCFCHITFKSYLLMRRQKASLCGKGMSFVWFLACWNYSRREFWQWIEKENILFINSLLWASFIINLRMFSMTRLRGSFIPFSNIQTLSDTFE